MEVSVNSPFIELLDLERKWEPEEGDDLRVEIETKHLNRSGVAHGGVVFTLCDCAMAVRLRRLVGQEVGISTIECKVNFLRSLKPGPASARGEIIHRTSRMVVMEARVFDADNEMVALALGTFRVFGLPEEKAT